MSDLSHDTALSPDGDKFIAQLSPAWEIWGPNGGYLATLVLRAAGQVAKIARPVSLHVHYQRVARFEQVELHARVIHAGRQAESIAVTMEQQGKPILSAMVRTAAAQAGLRHDASEAPAVAGPEDLPALESLLKDAHPRFKFWSNFERRVLQLETWDLPRPAQHPRWLEWMRYRTAVPREDPWLEAARAAILVDTMCWPAAWLHHLDDRFIAPSLDLTVWFHRPSESEWLLVDARAPMAEAGLLSGTCQVWNEQRKLVASGGGQMLCVPRG